MGYERNIARVWRSELCENSHFLVRCQGAWNILGYVEHCSQPWRFRSSYSGRHRSSDTWLELGFVGSRTDRPCLRNNHRIDAEGLPEARGFEAVEDVKVTATPKPTQEEEANSGEKLSLLQNLSQNVLSNPFIWGLAFTYFCVYVVRQGITSWSVFYLIKEKGVLDAGAAALRVSGLELGGLLGSLIAGRISDWYIATSPGGAVGKRIQVVMAYLIGVAAMLLAFQAVPAGLPVAQAIIVFMIGFFLYGPQMLIGCAAPRLLDAALSGRAKVFLDGSLILEQRMLVFRFPCSSNSTVGTRSS